MINGGMATVFVTDFERAVKFYTQTLGLKLTFRAGDKWASIDAGGGFTIGLHPAGTEHMPGLHGGTEVGLSVTVPMDQAVRTLTAKGVQFRGPVRQDGPMKLASFGDPDGNDLYLAGFG